MSRSAPRHLHKPVYKGFWIFLCIIIWIQNRYMIFEHWLRHRTSWNLQKSWISMRSDFSWWSAGHVKLLHICTISLPPDVSWMAGWCHSDGRTSDWCATLVRHASTEILKSDLEWSDHGENLSECSTHVLSKCTNFGDDPISLRVWKCRFTKISFFFYKKCNFSRKSC